MEGIAFHFRVRPGCYRCLHACTQLCEAARAIHEQLVVICMQHATYRRRCQLAATAHPDCGVGAACVDERRPADPPARPGRDLDPGTFWLLKNMSANGSMRVTDLAASTPTWTSRRCRGTSPSCNERADRADTRPRRSPGPAGPAEPDRPRGSSTADAGGADRAAGAQPGDLEPTPTLEQLRPAGHPHVVDRTWRTLTSTARRLSAEPTPTGQTTGGRDGTHLAGYLSHRRSWW